MSFKKGGYTLNARHSIPFMLKTFIHVRCVDDEGNPLKARPYVITLPDGQEVRGELDDDGWAKHDGIRPGECNFRLINPNLEGPDVGPGGPHFINVVVKDEDGRPLEGEPYVLGTGDGKVRRGELDHEGRVLEEKLPSGPCFFSLGGGKKQTENKNRYIRLQFMDDDGDPLAGRPFQIKVGEDAFDGMTDEDGRVIADLPGEIDDGQLTIWIDEDKSGESFTWPIRISEVAKSK